MKNTLWCKIISIISACALLISTLGIFSSVFAVSQGDSVEGLTLQEIAESSDIKVTNSTTQADLETALKQLRLPDGKTVEAITQFYKINSLEGAVERGSAYMTDPTEEIVLVEGEEGIVTALVTVSDSTGGTSTEAVSLTIEPDYEVYSFTTISNSMSDWSGNNSSGYKYSAGKEVDKIIIPDEITKLAEDWQQWQPMKCVVFGAGITKVTRSAWFKGEVVSFKGEVTSIESLAFHHGTQLKYIRLPDTVKTISSEAFYNCYSLKHLYLPEGLTRISENIFSKADDATSGHNLTELTIPSTVKDMYEPALLGALSDCTVTVLSTGDWHPANTFYDTSYPAKGSKYTVRVISGSGTDKYVNVAEGKKQYLDDMTLAEAIARATKVLNKKGTVIVEQQAEVTANADTILTELKNSYGNIPTVTAAWKNTDWTKNENFYENSLVFTKGEVTVEIPYSMAEPGTLDLQEIIDNSSLTVTNSSNSSDIISALNTIDLPEGYTVTGVTETYKLNAIGGAVEKGSTYEGAPEEEVLVEGVKGYLSAIVSLEDQNKVPYLATVIIDIEPTMAVYSFTSVSSDSDWIYNSAGWGQRWEYKPHGDTWGNAAQKVVVPDKVDGLKAGWHDFVDVGTVKCVVYNDKVTAIPTQHSFHNLEVVSIKGDVTEIGGSATGNTAFKDCGKLKYIKLPDSIKTIGARAFYGCTSLTSLYLPEGLETIGEKLFFDPDQSSHPGYNLSQITIPSTVKTIGQYAFADAKSDIIISVLTTAANNNESGIHNNAFGKDDGGYSDKITLRVIKGSGIDTDSVATAKAKTYFDNVSLLEAAAKAKQKADNISGRIYKDKDDVKEKSNEIKAEIIANYGSSAAVTANWEAEDWTDQNGILKNTLILTKGDVSALIAVYMYAPGTYALQSKVDEAGIKLSNSVTEKSLVATLNTLNLEGYKVDSVTEFYKVNAIDGAIEKGSTYEGAPQEEVLVEGKEGHLSAVVNLFDEEGKPYTATVVITIEPTMAVYSFASVSSDSDWTYNNAGWARRWEYNPPANKDGKVVGAEKIVVPDKVTELKGDWHNWDNRVGNARCIVYNENITVIPTQYQLGSLEVVSFKGEVTELQGNSTNAAFKDCGKLKYIMLPDSLKTIGTKAFYGCTSLTSLYLPEGLETIGDKVFFDPDQSSHPGYNLTEITIPSTVKTIGQYAFVNAKNNIAITVLTTAQNGDNGINNEAFYSSSYAEYSDKITLRVIEESGAASDQVLTSSGKKLLIKDDITVTEAAARTAYKNATLSGSVYENVAAVKAAEDAIKTELIVSYGSAATVTANWQNENWTENGALIENTLILTKNDVSFPIPVYMYKANSYDLQSVIDKSNIEITNETTKKGLLKTLQTLRLPTGYTVETITDFYKLNAVDGAIEVGSTYKGAVDGEILSPGEKGYISAVVTVRGSDGTPYTSAVIIDIEPIMEEFSFSTVSSEKDFTYNSAGWARRWEYHPMSGIAAEKVVIPDKVTELKADWHQSWQYGVRSNVRCIVYNENITVIPAQYNLYALEVVTLKGQVTELLSDGSNAAFKDCYNLKYLKLPDSIKIIEDMALYNCTSLKTLYLPEGLETIGDYMFFNPTQENHPGYNLTEITIPSTVKTIGQYAFINAKNSCEITVLTTAAADDKNGIHSEAFYSKDYAEYSNKAIVRVIKGSGAASDKVLTAANKKVSLQETMGFAEAAARAAKKANLINGTEATVEQIEAMISIAYGNVTTYKTNWENKVWNKVGNLSENYWLISRNGTSFRINIKASIVPVNLQEEVNNATVGVTDNTGEDEFAQLLDNALPAGYNLEKIIQYHKINSVPGAVDVTGGTKEVLVSGNIGNVQAIAQVIAPDGTNETVYVTENIAPLMEEYTFASVSDEADFTIENGVLVKYSGNAEKVVIPEGVIALGENWLSGISAKENDYNAKDTVIKCIVYPESLEGTVPDQNSLSALEVVSFKGDKVTVLGEKAFFKAENLKYINLPDSLETISSQALACGSQEFTKVYLPDGLKTIGDYAFYWSDGASEVAQHSITEITIPESVTSIGKYAFAEPQGDTFTITILNKDTDYSENMLAYVTDGAKITVRAFKDSDVYKALKGDSNYKLIALDEMTVTEAAARLSVKAADYAKHTYPSDIASKTVSDELIKAYANHKSFSYSWGDTWDTSTDAKRYGTLSVSDGNYTIGVKIELNVPPIYTLKDLVNAVNDITAKAEFTNSVTQASYKEYVESLIPGKYKIEILDYNLQRAVDGAKDSGGILVSGHKGSVASLIRVKDYYGNTQNVLCESVVNPVTREYSFASTSKSSDFILSDDGTVLLEYYGTAEKLVVPDGVVRIANSWMWRKPSYVKALVLPESLKIIPDNLCDGMEALEVVSMQNNVISVGANTFANCYSLKYLQLSDNIEEISEGMFKNTYSLMDVRIPESVLKIGNQAFYGSAVRNITVSSNVVKVGENAFANMLKSERYIGNDYFPIDEDVKTSVTSWVAENNLSDVPCIFTFLGEETEIAEKNFTSRDEMCPKYIVRAFSGSDAYAITEKLLAEGGTALDKWQLEKLDMSLVEAVARVNAKVRSLILYNGVTAEEIISYIENTFVSSAVKNDVVWAKVLSIVNASDSAQGSATGTLQFTSADGKYTFTVSLNNKVLLARPELSDDDTMGDYWGDDAWDDELWEDLLEDEFFEDMFEDVFEDFEDDFDDFEDFEDFEDEFEDEFEDDFEDEFTDEDSEDSSQTQKDTSGSKQSNSLLIWIIAGSVAALLVAGGVILLIIILKKRKKESQK